LRCSSLSPRNRLRRRLFAAKSSKYNFAVQKWEIQLTGEAIIFDTSKAYHLISGVLLFGRIYLSVPLLFEMVFPTSNAVFASRCYVVKFEIICPNIYPTRDLVTNGLYRKQPEDDESILKTHIICRKMFQAANEFVPIGNYRYLPPACQYRTYPSYKNYRQKHRGKESTVGSCYR